MKRSRFSDEQIIGILEEHEFGISVAYLCRKHGVCDAAIYKWKARFCAAVVFALSPIRQWTGDQVSHRSGRGNQRPGRPRSAGLPPEPAVCVPLDTPLRGPDRQSLAETPIVCSDT